MIEIDFETDAIEPRPKYPPRPVGVAVGWRGQGGRRYLGWGHPIGNNATKSEATKLLRAAYRSGEPLVFHNAAFDLDVAETHLGLRPPPWDRVHDTMFLAFLHDPFASSLSLKPLADRLLDLPPDEADELKEWIVANVKNPDGSKMKPSKWGAHIAKAPGGLVGRYAVGDIKRTGMLFKFLHEKIREAGMLSAYDRERRFLPVKMAMDRRGVAVATDRLRRDLRAWETALQRTDDWIGQRLGVPGLEIDKNIHLADALDSAGVVDEWEMTPTGKRSTAKEAIKRCLKDSEILSALSYRGRLATSVRNFGRPWLRVADGDGEGRIFCEWNQVRQANERGSGIVGARTGRISSTPNLMNVPKRPDLLAFSETSRRRLQKVAREQEVSVLSLPSDFHKFACPLPNLRDYLKPEKGRRLLIRDYSQQELRILGHFEGGPLLRAYLADPWLDVHALAQRLINELLMLDLPRKPIKNTGFGLIYGMGIGKLALKTEQPLDQAKRVKRAYLDIFPGLNELIRELKRRARRGEPYHTWGGRMYHCERPIEVDGEQRQLDYKMLNYLIQGSAADNTKEAAIRYHDAAVDGWLEILVHDEFIASADAGGSRAEMARLRDAMESVEFDVPMLSTGKIAAVSWARAKAFDDRRGM